MSRKPKFKFRLFVAGHAPNSTQAIANLDAFCRTHLPDQCEIEVVDVFRQPKRALAEGVFMTPTLVTVTPAAARRVVGTLNDPRTMLLALGLQAAV